MFCYEDSFIANEILFRVNEINSDKSPVSVHIWIVMFDFFTVLLILQYYIHLIAGNPVVANVLNSEIVVYEFEHQWHHWFYFLLFSTAIG